MAANPKVQVVALDDDASSLELIIEAISTLDDLEVRSFHNPVEALAHIRTHRPAIVISDLMMPEMSGLQVLEQVMELDASIEVVLLTAHYSTESAVEAIRKGASDYLNKPIEINVLREKVKTLAVEVQRRRYAGQLDQELLRTYEFHGIIGRSPLLIEVFSKIRRIAPHFQTALVTGATGTGKELVARALHQLGSRPGTPIAVCNCSSLVETLLESELFGHTKGSFTGATTDRAGLFETANGGTVFLDEIGELSLGAQAKLLRVLQNREIQRVGSSQVRTVNVRVVAATHRNLREMVREKLFREDLYYRLAMVEIALPRLSDRKEDVPLLLKHFVNKFAQQYGKSIRGISRRAQSVLLKYSWPGNIREMENVIGNACMMTETDLIDVNDLDSRVRTTLTLDDEPVTIEEVCRRHAARVLQRVDGNKAYAAQLLGISRSTLYKLISDGPPADRQPDDAIAD